jgi:hypothetical protein
MLFYEIKGYNCAQRGRSNAEEIGVADVVICFLMSRIMETFRNERKLVLEVRVALLNNRQSTCCKLVVSTIPTNL